MSHYFDVLVNFVTISSVLKMPSPFKCYVNISVNIVPMLTTISPLSLVDSVQRTPQLVVIGFCTGMVFYSFVSERYAAAFASGCLLDTSTYSWGGFKCKKRMKKQKFNNP